MLNVTALTNDELETLDTVLRIFTMRSGKSVLKRHLSHWSKIYMDV
jgi:hypothetical protein